ncbi:MAG: hypothetical protein U9R17_05255 [Thermodesulfobacteriota bacterium]|nr:hypothetical protein [Thermodesulfobacteriota bacterium]
MSEKEKVFDIIIEGGILLTMVDGEKPLYTDLVIQHNTNGSKLLYPAGLQINLTSARSGFRVNCFAMFPLVIDSIGLIARKLNL